MFAQNPKTSQHRRINNDRCENTFHSLFTKRNIPYGVKACQPLVSSNAKRQTIYLSTVVIVKNGSKHLSNHLRAMSGMAYYFTLEIFGREEVLNVYY